MARVNFRSAQAAANAANRQACAGYAASPSPGPDDPIAMAVVLEGPDGTALTTRDAAAPVATTANSTAGGQAALAALASRRWFLLMNLSATIKVYWRFGSTVAPALAFPLRPGGSVSFNGDLPNDALMVICDTGETAAVVAQQC